MMLLVLAGSVRAQTANDLQARDEAFARCDQIQRDREARYKLCKEYLNKYPADDNRHRDAAEKFVRAYERAMSYAKALQAFAISKPGSWFVYEPDLKIDLPNVEELSGNFKIKIERSFKNSDEEAMIKKAEAVYGPQFRYIDSMRVIPESWGDVLPDEIAPLWGADGNDNVMMTDVITASGVRYYYDLSISARAHQRFRNVFTMLSTSLKYNAAITHYEKWEHASAKYTGVYVVDLNLEWSSMCGGLCGVGFTRNKLVVLDNKGNVLEMYLDAPVNQSSWVS